MIYEIITEHGHPNFIVSDSGPNFRGEFIASLQEIDIDHASTAAYLAKANGKAEKSV